jgi:threonine dehydrogenase-like Zn-dependent dehydrogenase
VRALVVTPGVANSTSVEDVPDARPGGSDVLLRTVAVGVCGTDRDIDEGIFGVPPDDRDRLILGHEFLGRVERDGNGFSSGQLVAGTVRRPCGHCIPCDEGAPDACDTGDYRERGITRLDGYASELVVESPENLIAVPASLGGLGVLAEPASICARGIRHARAVGGRQPWQPRRALVLGAGAIGMLATYFLRLDGLEVWTAGHRADETRKRLVEASGATWFASVETPAKDVADDVGGFDIVIEATGNAQVMIDTLALLRRNGVSCLLGIDGHERQVCIDGRVIGVDAILQNRALIGSVNAHKVDWQSAVDHLARAYEQWPDALDEFVGLRVPLDRFKDAFEFRGVKAALEF